MIQRERRGLMWQVRRRPREWCLSRRSGRLIAHPFFLVVVMGRPTDDAPALLSHLATPLLRKLVKDEGFDVYLESDDRSKSSGFNNAVRATCMVGERKRPMPILLACPTHHVHPKRMLTFAAKDGNIGMTFWKVCSITVLSTQAKLFLSVNKCSGTSFTRITAGRLCHTSV